MEYLDRELQTPGFFVPTHTSVSDFFARMEKAFNNWDIKTLVNQWSYPSLILKDHEVQINLIRSEVEDYFLMEREIYKMYSVKGTKADIKWVEWASDRIVVVDVRWPFLTEDGEELGGELWKYLLKYNEHEELKIYLAAQTGILP